MSEATQKFQRWERVALTDEARSWRAKPEKHTRAAGTIIRIHKTDENLRVVKWDDRMTPVSVHIQLLRHVEPQIVVADPAQQGLAG